MVRFAFHYALHTVFPVRRRGAYFAKMYATPSMTPTEITTLNSASKCITCGLCNAAQVVQFYARNVHNPAALALAPPIGDGVECPYGVDLPGLRRLLPTLQVRAERSTELVR